MMVRPRKYDYDHLKSEVGQLIAVNTKANDIVAHLQSRGVDISNRTLKRQVSEWRQQDLAFPQGRTKPTPENGFQSQPTMIIKPNRTTAYGKAKRKPRPPPEKYIRATFAQRVQAMTLLTHKYNSTYIEQVTGVRKRTLRRIATNARRRGYDFAKDPKLLDRYFEGSSYEPPLPGTKEALLLEKKDAARSTDGDLMIVQEDGTMDADMSDSEEDSSSDEDGDDTIDPNLEFSIHMPVAASPVTNTGADATMAFQSVQHHLAGIQEFLRASNDTGQAAVLI